MPKKIEFKPRKKIVDSLTDTDRGSCKFSRHRGKSVYTNPVELQVHYEREADRYADYESFKKFMTSEQNDFSFSLLKGMTAVWLVANFPLRLLNSLQARLNNEKVYNGSKIHWFYLHKARLGEQKVLSQNLIDMNGPLKNYLMSLHSVYLLNHWDSFANYYSNNRRAIKMLNTALYLFLMDPKKALNLVFSSNDEPYIIDLVFKIVLQSCKNMLSHHDSIVSSIDEYNENSGLNAISDEANNYINFLECGSGPVSGCQLGIYHFSDDIYTEMLGNREYSSYLWSSFWDVDKKKSIKDEGPYFNLRLLLLDKFLTLETSKYTDEIINAGIMLLEILATKENIHSFHYNEYLKLFNSKLHKFKYCLKHYNLAEVDVNNLNRWFEKLEKKNIKINLKILHKLVRDQVNQIKKSKRNQNSDSHSSKQPPNVSMEEASSQNTPSQLDSISSKSKEASSMLPTNVPSKKRKKGSSSSFKHAGEGSVSHQGQSSSNGFDRIDAPSSQTRSELYRLTSPHRKRKKGSSSSLPVVSEASMFQLRPMAYNSINLDQLFIKKITSLGSHPLQEILKFQKDELVRFVKEKHLRYRDFLLWITASSAVLKNTRFIEKVLENVSGFRSSLYATRLYLELTWYFFRLEENIKDILISNIASTFDIFVDKNTKKLKRNLLDAFISKVRNGQSSPEEVLIAILMAENPESLFSNSATSLSL